MISSVHDAPDSAIWQISSARFCHLTEFCLANFCLANFRFQISALRAGRVAEAETKMQNADFSSQEFSSGSGRSQNSDPKSQDPNVNTGPSDPHFRFQNAEATSALKATQTSAREISECKSQCTSERPCACPRECKNQNSNLCLACA